jgi:hypothetical protein
MAYDKVLAERVRASFGNIPIVEKKMFGGIESDPLSAWVDDGIKFSLTLPPK